MYYASRLLILSTPPPLYPTPYSSNPNKAQNNPLRQKQKQCPATTP